MEVIKFVFPFVCTSFMQTLRIETERHFGILRYAEIGRPSNEKSQICPHSISELCAMFRQIGISRYAEMQINVRIADNSQFKPAS